MMGDQAIAKVEARSCKHGQRQFGYPLRSRTPPWHPLASLLYIISVHRSTQEKLLALG